MPANDNDPYRRWLLSLPDQVAEAKESFCPVVLPDPGTEHGRALYKTLGVLYLTSTNEEP